MAQYNAIKEGIHLRIVTTNSALKSLIDEVVHSERDREILCKKYIDGKTHETISYEMDLSVRSVSRIIEKYKEILFSNYIEI